MSAITEGLAKYGITGEQADKFDVFFGMLDKTNKAFNLTRISSAEETVRLHFLDSLAPFELGLLKDCKSICDGAGGGFPCVPLAIVLGGKVRITALEASEKKLAFISEVSKTLGLGINCICARAEEEAAPGKALREGFDACVTRALAPMNVLIELCAPFVKTGGKLICYKGRDAEAEVTAALKAAQKLALGQAALFDAHIEGTEHKIVVYEKRGRTPKEYPRRFARIKAFPL